MLKDVSLMRICCDFMLRKQGHSPGRNAAFERPICQVLFWEKALLVATLILSIPEIWVHLGRVHIGQNSQDKKKLSHLRHRLRRWNLSIFTICKVSTLTFSSHESVPISWFYSYPRIKKKKKKRSYISTWSHQDLLWMENLLIAWRSVHFRLWGTYNAL